MHSVNFNSSGDKLAWVGHDSSISVADAAKEMAVSVVQTDFLPFLACKWLSDKAIVAAVSYFNSIIAPKMLQNLN